MDIRFADHANKVSIARRDGVPAVGRRPLGVADETSRKCGRGNLQWATLVIVSVFGSGPRKDLDPALHGEPHASYLNRSGRAEFAMARERINGWFNHLCPELQAGVRTRLRSRDDQEFASAYWELFLHELFIRLGYQVTCEPVLPNGRRIDFLVTSGSSSMYVEATIARSSGAERAADARRSRLYREIEQLRSDNFMVGIEIENAGSGDIPNIGRLRTALERWLADLDPDAATEVWETSETIPELRWEAAGWSMIFEAFPVRPETRGQPIDRPLGMFMDETGGLIDDETRLRRALARKAASRYGDLDCPYVVAVNEHPFAPGHSDWHRKNVLFGRDAVTFGDGQPARSIRQPDGHWRGPAQRPRNRRLSAVLLCDDLYVWQPERAVLEWWDNPFANRPVPDELVPAPSRRQRLEMQGSEGTFVTIEPLRSMEAVLNDPLD